MSIIQKLLRSLKADSENAGANYHTALQAYRDALQSELDVVDYELARLDNIEGPLLPSDNQLLDTLEDRRSELNVMLSGLYH